MSYIEPQRPPNKVVAKLTRFFQFFGDFGPMVSAIWGFFGHVFLTLCVIFILVANVILSASHSLTLLERAGYPGWFAWLAMGAWELLFIVGSIILTNDFRRGDRLSGWAPWSAFGFGFGFVEYSNYIGMSNTPEGKAVGIATPILMLIAKGLIAHVGVQRKKERLRLQEQQQFVIQEDTKKETHTKQVTPVTSPVEEKIITNSAPVEAPIEDKIVQTECPVEAPDEEEIHPLEAPEEFPDEEEICPEPEAPEEEIKVILSPVISPQLIAPVSIPAPVVPPEEEVAVTVSEPVAVQNEATESLLSDDKVISETPHEIEISTSEEIQEEGKEEIVETPEQGEPEEIKVDTEVVEKIVLEETTEEIIEDKKEAPEDTQEIISEEKKVVVPDSVECPEEEKMESPEVVKEETTIAPVEDKKEAPVVIAERTKTAPEKEKQKEIPNAPVEKMESDIPWKSRIEAIALELFCSTRKVPPRKEIKLRFEEFYVDEISEYYPKILHSSLKQFVKKYFESSNRNPSRKEIIRFFKGLYRNDNRDFADFEKAVEEQKQLKSKAS